MRHKIRTLSRLARLVILCFLCAAPAKSQSDSESPAITHYGYSATDKLLKCIQNVYGKPVSSSPDFQYRLHADLPCPKTREGIQELLQTRVSSLLIVPGRGPSGVLLFETADWVYVIPAMLFNPAYPGRQRWKRITIATLVDVDDSISESEANALVPEILKNARMIFLQPLGSISPEIRAADDEVAVAVRLRFYKKRLRADSPDAIITVIDQPNLLVIGRIVYGEMRDGKYQMLWDSPLLNGHGGVGFADVNGDGWDEIVWESATCGAQNCDPHQLVVFDKAGHEITRQHPQDCPNDQSTFDATDGVCAIEGEDIRITVISPYPGDPGPHEPKDIVAITSQGDNDPNERIFVLDNGMYVPSKLSRDSLAKIRKAKFEREAAVLNEQGMTMMKEGKYNAAAKNFEQAAQILNLENPDYDYNAGYACFKDGNYNGAASDSGMAIRMDPRRAMAYLIRADSLAVMSLALKSRPDNFKSYPENFCADIRDSCLAEARKDYEKYLQLAPDSKDAPDVKKKLAALPPNP